jgi:hypothetical protein
MVTSLCPHFNKQIWASGDQIGEVHVWGIAKQDAYCIVYLKGKSIQQLKFSRTGDLLFALFQEKNNTGI